MKQIKVVAAIIHDDKDRIFATQRGYGDYKDWWEFPGGKMEAGGDTRAGCQGTGQWHTARMAFLREVACNPSECCGSIIFFRLFHAVQDIFEKKVIFIDGYRL